jgi:uncharacterized protein (DUF2147 family)
MIAKVPAIVRIFIAALFACIGAGVAHADPRGVWLAQDGAHIRVASCGGGLCATVVAPRSTVDPDTGAPWTDKHNPDAALRGRPIVGVMVLYNMEPDGAGKWSGTLYNVDDGHTYAGHLLELNERTIRIEGCALIMCGGKELSRLQ